MDIFIKLLSRLNRAGMNPTIGAIHWVLAVNWQIALGTKIGVDHLASFKHLLIARKLHLSLSTYNRAHLFKDCFLNSVRSVKGSTAALLPLKSTVCELAVDAAKEISFLQAFRPVLRTYLKPDLRLFQKKEQDCERPLIPIPSTRWLFWRRLRLSLRIC